MGFARILSGGTNGRYSIEIDYGEATRQGLLTSITAVIASIDSAIASVSVLILEGEVKEAAAIAAVNAARDALIAATLPGLPAGSPKPDTAGFRFAVKRLTDLKAIHEPLRIRKESLRHQRAIAVNRAAAWSAFTAVETRNAWCTDYTDDAAPGSYAATVEIPGDSSLILLAPGCRTWSEGDGILTAREILSPEQAYLNAAILPGWQKFKPTYRWGTCTGINYDANTMDVSLFAQSSTAQGLSVNQASALTSVPVVYMTCNALAFEIDDRVVVQFVGQDWANPRVIGFLDNPKRCNAWQLFQSDYIQDTILDDDSADFSRLTYLEYKSYFADMDQWLLWETEAASGTLLLRVRQAGGAWSEYTVSPIAGGWLGINVTPGLYGSNNSFNFVRELTGAQRMIVSVQMTINSSSPIGTYPTTSYPQTSDAVFEFLATKLDGGVIYNAAFRIKNNGTANEFKHYHPVPPDEPGSYTQQINVHPGSESLTDVGLPSMLDYTLYADTL